MSLWNIAKNRYGASMDIGHDLGINLQRAVAGFAGGMVYALVMKQVRAIEAVSSVLVGTATANYLTDYVIKLIGFDGGGMAFLTGLIAMVLCQAIIAAARNIRLPFGRSPDTK